VGGGIDVGHDKLSKLIMMMGVSATAYC